MQEYFCGIHLDSAFLPWKKKECKRKAKFVGCRNPPTSMQQRRLTLLEVHMQHWWSQNIGWRSQENGCSTIPWLMSKLPWLAVDSASIEPFGLTLESAALWTFIMRFWQGSLSSPASMIPDVPRYDNSDREHACIAANSSIHSLSSFFFLHNSMKFMHACLNETRLRS